MIKYAIMVDYNMWSEEKGEYTEPNLLGLEGERKIFIFEPDVTGCTKLFNTMSEANKYLKAHKTLTNSCCFENARVVIVKI